MLLGQISLNFPFNFGGLQHDKDFGYAPDFTLDGSEYSNTTQENSLIQNLPLIYRVQI